MTEVPRTIPDETARKRRVESVVWWVMAGCALLLVGFVALFIVEPEREIDPPASPIGLAIVAALWIGGLLLLLGAPIGWVVREFRRRRRVG